MVESFSQIQEASAPTGDTVIVKRTQNTQWVALKKRHSEPRKPQPFIKAAIKYDCPLSQK